MRALHCRLCQDDPPKIEDVLGRLDESLSKDSWFEASSCTVFVLRRYLDILSNRILDEFPGHEIDRLMSEV